MLEGCMCSKDSEINAQEKRFTEGIEITLSWDHPSVESSVAPLPARPVALCALQPAATLGGRTQSWGQQGFPRTLPAPPLTT